MKLVLFVALSFMMATAHASTAPESYCYDQAVVYKNLMHKQVLADLDLDNSVNVGEETLAYTPDRYALDNIEEEFTFSIPIGNTENGYTYLNYTVVIEAWITTSNKASICDVIKFSHEKTF